MANLSTPEEAAVDGKPSDVSSTEPASTTADLDGVTIVGTLGGLPEGPWLRLDDALNYALLGGTAPKASGDPRAKVFFFDFNLALRGSILFGVENKAAATKRMQEFERRLTQAGQDERIRFRGAKSRVELTPDPGRVIAAGSEPIPSGYFDRPRDDRPRGFDVDTCRITAISHLDMNYKDVDFLMASSDLLEWENVHVERDGFMKWLRDEYPQVGISETRFRELLREAVAKGEVTSQRAAEAFAAMHDYNGKRADIRALYMEFTPDARLGRPRKKAPA